jgi:hypothetical protein
MATAAEAQTPPQTLPTGKHSCRSVDEVLQVDPQYVWFLSQRNLTHVHLLQYKAFFDWCPGVVNCAKEVTEGLRMPVARQPQTPTSIFQPGGCR